MTLKYLVAAGILCAPQWRRAGRRHADRQPRTGRRERRKRAMGLRTVPLLVAAKLLLRPALLRRPARLLGAAAPLSRLSPLVIQDLKARDVLETLQSGPASQDINCRRSS